MFPVLARLLWLGSLLHSVESNGVFMLKNMGFLSTLGIQSAADAVSGETGLLICLIWVAIICGIVWSLWMETNATTESWRTYYIFKTNEVDISAQILKDLPVRTKPKTLDRRSSSIAKSSIDASNQV